MLKIPKDQIHFDQFFSTDRNPKSFPRTLNIPIHEIKKEKKDSAKQN